MLTFLPIFSSGPQEGRLQPLGAMLVWDCGVDALC